MSRRNKTIKLSMKKLFLTIIAFVFVLGFMSCKNECKCKVTYINGSKEEDSERNMTKDECKAAEAILKIYPGVKKANCTYR